MEENFEEKNEVIENEVVENEATVVDEKGFVIENQPVDSPEQEEVKSSCEKKCNCQIVHWSFPFDGAYYTISPPALTCGRHRHTTTSENSSPSGLAPEGLFSSAG